MANLYVNKDYNSSTEGWGTTHFSSYSAAYAYATANAKNSTIVMENTTSLSGNCIDNNHKNYRSLNLTIEDGALVGYAGNKFDITFDLTVNGGGKLVTARPANRPNYTHVKDSAVFTIGEAGSEKKAEVNFLDYSTYAANSLCVLYNGSMVMDNAIFKVGDFGLVGKTTINNSEITVGGTIGFGIYQAGSAKTMTNSTMTVKGHNIFSKNNYFAWQCNTIGSLTMDNSSIVVDDGVSDTVAGKVYLGYTLSGWLASKQTLTMTNGSSITVEKGTDCVVNAALTMTDSSLNVGSLTVDADRTLSLDLNSTIAFTSLTNNGTIAITGDLEADKLYKLFDYTGEGTMTADDYKKILGDAYTADFTVIDSDLYASKLFAGDIYINPAWAGKYENAEEIEAGKVFGVNAFASFAEADAFTAGTRTFRYSLEAGVNVKVSISCENVVGDSTLDISGIGEAISNEITEGNTFATDINLNAADNNGELVFTVTGAAADYTIDVDVATANSDTPQEIGTITAGTTNVTEGGVVSMHLNAASYDLTVSDKELCEYSIDLKNNNTSTVYVEIYDELGNRIFNTSSSSDISRTIPALANGNYTITVDVPQSITQSYETEFDLYLTKTDLLDDGNGGSSAAYIKDSDDAIDSANTATTAITDWVGKLDTTDWYQLDMSAYAAGDSFKATLEAAGTGVRATVVKVSGGSEITVGNLYTSSSSSRTFAYDGSSEYFVKFTNTTSNTAKSIYSMSIASA